MGKFTVDEADKRFDAVTDKGAADLTASDKMFDDQIALNDKTYDDAIGKYTIDENDGVTTAVEQLMDAKKQQTEANVAQIEQQKVQEGKKFDKTVADSYGEYRRNIDPHGVNAEKIASMGLSDSGFAEGSKVAMLVSHQNEVAIARASYDQAVMNYNNMIINARNQNSVELAQMALDALEKQTTLSLEKIANHDELVRLKASARLEIEKQTAVNYQSVLDQINLENANNADWEKFELNYGLDAMNYELKVKEFNEGIRQFDEEIARLKAEDASANAYKIQQLELQKEELEQRKKEHEDSQGSLYLNDGAEDGNGGNDGGVEPTSTVHTTKVAEYLTNGDAYGATEYLETTFKNGGMTKQEYQGAFFDIAMSMTGNVTAQNIGESIKELEMWKKHGRLTEADFTELSKYCYQKIGTAVSPEDIGFDTSKANGGGLGNRFIINGTDYTATKFWNYGTLSKTFNGIATGKENVNPEVGTVVRYDGKTYAYTKDGWRKMEARNWEDTVGDEIDKYWSMKKGTPTHTAEEPSAMESLTESEKKSVWKTYEDAAKAGHSNIKTQREWARSKEGCSTYEDYLAKMYKRYA